MKRPPEILLWDYKKLPDNPAVRVLWDSMKGKLFGSSEAGRIKREERGG
ncbi:hypothetical protein [Thermosulfurimonas sp. F29]|nr:hypothetical protein [Thermosulfurimonas sp. F29]MBX6422609.1 hypothetical protein [Thermosulfurimonas sp. F29]